MKINVSFLLTGTDGFRVVFLHPADTDDGEAQNDANSKVGKFIKE
jgi:hypothetical protein